MQGRLRVLVPFVLLVLGGLCWFESFLPGHEWVAKTFGETAVLRFALGLFCLIGALITLELFRVELLFKQVVQQFRTFHESHGKAVQEPPEVREEAVRILIAALDSQDPAVRKSALDNLRRLTGKDLGAEPGPWVGWADREFRER